MALGLDQLATFARVAQVMKGVLVSVWLVFTIVLPDTFIILLF